MWFATSSGLYEFFGTSFQLHSKPELTGQSEIPVVHLILNKGFIYTFGFKTCSVFDIKTRKYLENFKIPSNLIEFASGSVTAHTEIESGAILLGSMAGAIGVWDLGKNTFNPDSHYFRKGNQADPVLNLILDRTGCLWILTQGSLHRKGVNSLAERSLEPLQGCSWAFCTYDSGSNEIWLAEMGSGICRFDLSGNKAKRFLAKGKDQKNIVYFNYVGIKSKDEIWVGSNGLGVFNKSTFSFQFTEEKLRDDFGFRTGKITKIFNDADGNHWICSFNGLSLLASAAMDWQILPLTEGPGQTWLEPYKIIDIPGSPEFLLTSSCRQGLILVSKMDFHVSIQRPAGWPGIPVTDGAVSTTGKIFLESGGNFYSYQAKTNRMEKIRVPFEMERVGGITGVISGPSDWVALGSQSGKLFLWNCRKDIWIQPDLNSGNATIVPLLWDSRDRIWCNRGELFGCWDVQGKRWLDAEISVSGTHEPTKGVTSAAEDADGNLWVASRHAGLLKITDEGPGLSALVKVLKGVDEGTMDFCTGVSPGKGNTLWLGTLTGLAQVDGQSGRKIRLLSREDGLPYQHASVVPGLIEKRWLLLPYYGFLVARDLNKPIANDVKERLELISVLVNGKEILFHGHPDKGSPDLLSAENNFTFSFSNLNYSKVFRNHYLFKLEGMQDAFYLAPENQKIEFFGLPPGAYVFHLIAENEQGLKSSGGISFPFVILPPFYKTKTFLWSSLVTVLLLVWGFLRYRISTARKEMDKKIGIERERLNLELKALRAKMNPHFIFNAMNSIQSYILKNDRAMASDYLGKFARLMRMVLNFSGNATISLQQELTMVEHYVEIEQLRTGHGFTYELQLDPTIHPESHRVPPLLLQPFIENSIWHGFTGQQSGKITLIIQPAGQAGLNFILRDNGSGWNIGSYKPKTGEESPHAMQITSDRINLFNQSNEGMGFNVSLDQPGPGTIIQYTLEKTIPS